MQCSAHVHTLSVRTVRAVMLVGHKGNHQRLGRFASNEKRHIIWRTQSPKLCRGRRRGPFAKRRQASLVGALRVGSEMTGAAKSWWNSPASGYWWRSRVTVGLMIGKGVYHTSAEHASFKFVPDPQWLAAAWTPSHYADGNERVLSWTVVRSRLGAGTVPLRIIAQQQCYCKRVPAGTGCTPSSPSHFGSMQHRPHAWIDC